MHTRQLAILPREVIAAMPETTSEADEYLKGEVEEGYEMTPTRSQGPVQQKADKGDTSQENQDIEVEQAAETGVEPEEEQEEVEVKEDETHGSPETGDGLVASNEEQASGEPEEDAMEQVEPVRSPGKVLSSTPSTGGVGGVGKVLNSGIFGGESSALLRVQL
jgi:hypothetical protein